jgi:hypothetical protein
MSDEVASHFGGVVRFSWDAIFNVNVLSFDIAKRLQSFQQSVLNGVLSRGIIIGARHGLEKSYLRHALWLLRRDGSRYPDHPQGDRRNESGTCPHAEAPRLLSCNDWYYTTKPHAKNLIQA